MRPGFMIAAPQSGSGKTTLTLGLLRALRDRGLSVRAAKAGPDYIDPAFHAHAAGTVCVNLDPWAMREPLIRSLAESERSNNPLVVEAMMGLFDGAADGTGSAADLASLLKLPVILVVDAARQSHSIAALAQGFRQFRGDVDVAGVILNRVGSARHLTLLRDALSAADIPVFGAVPRDNSLRMPSRHLGLVQAGERSDLEEFVEYTARVAEANIDIDHLLALTFPTNSTQVSADALSPPGQRIAVAKDEAFAFSYSHLLTGWREQGAELFFFSPLADEPPATDCDAVFLPGGYPELHGARIAAAETFLGSLRSAADRSALVYGECGGYMVLGEGLIDARGERHKMAGLLGLVTSFENPLMTLGYRVLTPSEQSPAGFWRTPLSGHEFHYTRAVVERGIPLFGAADAVGTALGDAGLISGSVCGSYMHVIDRR